MYDEPNARRTNEDFIDDVHWYGKYRQMLGNQDQHNLAYYQQAHGYTLEKLEDLNSSLARFRSEYHGLIVWDENLLDTINIAVMLAGQESLLPVTHGMTGLPSLQNCPLVHDLRGKWADRLQVYQWAFDNLFPGCLSGAVSCIEPGWQRPEFLDYLVQEKIFIYSLSSVDKGLGSQLLLLLAFGPPALRELIFALRLDGPLRRFALRWMEKHSPEVALGSRIQKSVRSDRYPTIFGWHTQRDDELSFMLQLSANGLRLAPSHLASNFSFHSRVAPLGFLPEQEGRSLTLDPDGIYLTFTLSDGDQLMMMNTDELGNWRSPARGRVAFNWETQPLLIELAPALLEKYVRQATPLDCLIAGPSGAGYIIPPLAPDLPAYMAETTRLCRKAGIRVVTSYVADPPRRILRQLAKHKGDLLGYLAGYALVNRAPQFCRKDLLFFANQVPRVDEIWLEADALLERVQALVAAMRQRPAFISVHLFAYRTTIEDVMNFTARVGDEHLHVVRADEFLVLFCYSHNSLHEERRK